MKNLKKILSLALALMMVLSISLTVSATDVSDKEDIVNKDSFELLSSLDIMKGHANGSFDPAGNLTRAQTAKMIYVARTGGVDDNAEMFKGTTMFADVADSLWSKGYINYAASKGFVVGRLNGGFDPEGKISGYEFMKILLCALGYDSATEGFENDARWQINIITVAKEIGLTNNYTGNPAEPIIRDDAALIMANMLYLNTVSYNTNGNLVADKSFGEKYLGLERVNGILVANEFAAIDGAITKAGQSTLKIGENYVTLPVASTIDQLGYDMTALLRVKANQTLTGTDGKYNENAIANVYGALNETAGKNSVKSLATDKAADDVKYFVNFKAIAEDGAKAIADLKAGSKKVAISNDGDAKYDLVLAINYSFGQVSSITTTGNYYVAGSTLNAENTLGLDGIVKGDFVRFFQVDGGKYIAEKAEVITATPSGYTAAYVMIDGVKYLAADKVDTSKIDLKNDNVFYVLDGYIYRFDAAAVATSNYAYVTRATVVGWDHKVSAVLDNGTVKDFNVYNAEDIELKDGKIPAGIYNYQLTEDGQLILSNGNSTASNLESDLSYTKGVNKINGKYVDNNSVVFMQVGTKWYVYTGIGNIPSFTAKQDSSMLMTTGKMISENDLVKALVLTNAEATSTAQAQYVVMSEMVTIADGKVSFKAFNGTEIVDMQSTDKNLVVGGIYNFVFGANNVVNKATAVKTEDQGYVSFARDSSIQISKAKPGAEDVGEIYFYNADTKVIAIDLKAGTADAERTVADLDVYSAEALQEVTANTFNTVIVLNSNNVVTHVYSFAQAQTIAD